MFGRFSQIVAERAEEPALTGAGGYVSYAELAAQAAAWSSSIVAAVGEGSGRVCLLGPNDIPTVAAILGALRAGKTVVGLGVNEPAARLAAVCHQAEAELIIVDRAHRALALDAGFAPDRLVHEPAPGPVTPSVAHAADAQAFVTFTSGSTGVPKGVVRTHRDLVGILARRVAAEQIDVDSRIAQLFPLNFSGGLSLLFLGLLTGACVCTFDLQERGVGPLADWVERERLTHLTMGPTILRSFVATVGERKLTRPRFFNLGGEVAFGSDFALFEQHFPEHCTFTTSFGSSETGVLTSGEVPRGTRVKPDDRLPAGRALPGVWLQLVDDDGRPAAHGAIGELVVTADYLTSGYWRDERLTAERFGVNEQGRRVVRTGDLALIDDNGLLTLAGRKDTMVKVRGNRVELTEVEAALRSLAGIKAATVCAASSLRGTQLVAYLVASDPLDLRPSDVRTELSLTLPPYAIPTAFVEVDGFPLSPNGKIDRAGLLQSHPPRLPGTNDIDWASPTEELLVRIWSEALDLPGVLRADNFLDLGGDSMTAAVIAANVQATFRVAMGMQQLLESPTIAAMAAVVDRELLDGADATERAAPITHADPDAPIPLAFGQERIWRYSRGLADNMALMQRLRGPLDPDVLRRAILAVTEQHEVFRTVIVDDAAGVHQRPIQGLRPDVRLIDLAGEPDPRAAAERLLAQASVEPFDLTRESWFRFSILRVSPDDHYLLRASHHIGSDGPSWSVFYGELEAHYLAATNGGSPPETPTIQFTDYAVWQRQQIENGSDWLLGEVTWWENALQGVGDDLTLPFARAHVVTDADPQSGRLFWAWPEGTADALERVSRELLATSFAVRLACFAAALQLDRPRPDVVLGAYVTNRTRPELLRMIGFIANAATVRIRIDTSKPFAELVATARNALLDIAAHSEIPYELLADELRARGFTPPPIRAIVQGMNTRPYKLPGVTLERLPRATPVHPWGFTIDFTPVDTAGNMLLLFDPREHDPAVVRTFIDQFCALATEVCANPAATLEHTLQAVSGR